MFQTTTGIRAKEVHKLIKACQKKEEDALERMYGFLYNDLMLIAVRYQSSQEDAEEACNDSYLKIISKLKYYKPTSSFKAWAKKVAINHNIDLFRTKNTKKIEMNNGELKDHHGAQSRNAADEQFDADLLIRLIQELPELERQVFNLFAIDGYKHQEISEMLKFPVGTSKSLLHHARKKLKDKLAKYQQQQAILTS